MPELPEVETIVRGLRLPLIGKVFDSVKILWRRSICGDIEAFAGALNGRSIEAVQRKGKYIIFTLSRDLRLTVHLKMTGKLLFRIDEKDRNYIRVVFRFADGSSLYFVDVRKFGRLKVWQPGEKFLPGLGPDPLDFRTVFEVLRRLESRRAVKTVLLDQRQLAGVGNIYADESLFLAGIHPNTPFSSIKKSKIEDLSKQLPLLLERAIQHSGTTLADYRTPENQTGSHQGFLKVYGREGLPCVTCKTAITRICINGRSAHFCPRCQPGT